jgi:RES domain-containing protein
MRVWRLVKASHRQTAFDGEGAFRFGGRWNSRGHRVVYASESLALALLEIIVHLDPARSVPELLAFPVDIPLGCFDSGDWIGNLCPETLPSWDQPLGQTRERGDRWCEAARSAALRVPSAIIPIEQNILLNPAHPEFRHCEIGAPQVFHFDPRLLKA